MLTTQHKSGEALALYRLALPIRERLAGADPANAGGQIGLVVALMRLVEAGDDPRARLVRVLKILSDLDAEGKLTADQKIRMKDVESQLAASAK